MAGTKATLRNSTGIAVPTGANKTILQYTAPSGVAAEVPRMSIGLDGTSSSAAKVLVRVVRGATGGTSGASVNPAAAGSTNAAGVSLGSGAENFSSEPSGGTEIWADYVPAYANFPIPLPPGLVIAPGETIGVTANAGASVNARANMQINL